MFVSWETRANQSIRVSLCESRALAPSQCFLGSARRQHTTQFANVKHRLALQGRRAKHEDKPFRAALKTSEATIVWTTDSKLICEPELVGVIRQNFPRRGYERRRPFAIIEQD